MENNQNYGVAWQGDDKPYEASYGKLMMWFFLVPDALTFSAFLGAYGFSRFKFPQVWPVPEESFMTSSLSLSVAAIWRIFHTLLRWVP